MSRRRILAICGVAAVLVLLGLAGEAVAQGATPFGVAPPPEPGTAAPGSSLFAWIAAQQSAFYKALTGTVKAIRDDPSALAALVGLSFAYGIFHAAGPGHGKAVITAYVLANRETARRGALLSFASAFVQALAAIIVVSVGVLVLSATSRAMSEATQAIEILGYGLITALGLWLVWSRVLRLGGHGHAHDHSDHGHPDHGDHIAERVAVTAPAAHVHHHHHDHDHEHHDHAHDHAHHHAHAAHDHDHGAAHPHAQAHDHGHPAAPAHVHGHDHVHDDACGCGHAHVPDPRALAGPFSWRRAAAAVISVGIRPCTGALIVLVFAFSQGLYAAGILSAFAMAIGTGVTVATLVLIAVGSRSVATRIAGADSPWNARLHRLVEVAGALVVLAFGVLLLGGALFGQAIAGG